MLIGYEYVIGSPDAWFKKKKDDLEYTKELEQYNSNIEWKRGEPLNFEIFIPENVKRSYQ